MTYTEIRLTAKDQPLLKALQSVDHCPYQDLCILSRTGPVFAHKFILAKISRFLETVLKDVPPHVDACITLADFDASDVKIVLELVYCGNIAVHLEKESQVTHLLTSLKIEFTACGVAIKDISGVSGNTLEGSNLSLPIATEEEPQPLINPKVRIKRLTEEEILRFTKRDRQLLKIGAGPSCHSRHRGRRRDEGQSLGDTTNQFVNECLNSSVNIAKKNTGIWSRPPSITREPEDHAEQKFFVSRNPLNVVDTYEDDQMVDQNSTGQEGDETAFLVSETELDIKGLIQELQALVDEKEASGSVEEDEASSPSSRGSATCVLIPAAAGDAEVKEMGLSPVADLVCTVKSLKKRRKICTGKKEHACNTCRKIFHSPSHLKVHELMHTGEKPFMCYICGKSFTRRGDLNYHHVVHSKVKAHSCSFCEKAFAFPWNLKSHISAVHMQKKDFSCSSCGKSFCNKYHRDIHFQIKHMNVTPYECGVCGAKYHWPAGLRRHKKKHI